jgi:hypothetical protein
MIHGGPDPGGLLRCAGKLSDAVLSEALKVHIKHRLS